MSYRFSSKMKVRTIATVVYHCYPDGVLKGISQRRVAPEDMNTHKARKVPAPEPPRGATPGTARRPSPGRPRSPPPAVRGQVHGNGELTWEEVSNFLIEQGMRGGDEFTVDNIKRHRGLKW